MYPMIHGVMKPFLPLFAVTALAVSGAAVAQSSHFDFREGDPIKIGGLNATQGGRIAPRGGLSGLPAPRSTQDIEDMLRSSVALSQLRDRMVAQGDVLGALTANHFANRFYQYYVYTSSSTLAALEELQYAAHGRMNIPAEGMVVLPAASFRPQSVPDLTDYGPRAQPSALIERMTGIDPWALWHGEFAQIASLGGVSQGGGSAEQFDALPVGVPVTLQNGVVVERTADAFVVHNQTGRAQPVALEELGYMPPLAELPDHHVQAKPILDGIVESQERVFWHADNPLDFEVRVGQPNRIIQAREDWAQAYRMDPVGQLSDDMQLTREAESMAKDEWSPFGYAIRLAERSMRTREYLSFVEGCRHAGQTLGVYSVPHRKFDGPSNELIVYTCSTLSNRELDGDIEKRQFYIGPEGMIMTWSSLMRQEATQARIAEFDERTRAMEHLVQIIPIAGNFESGAKCLTSGRRSYTRGVAQRQRFNAYEYARGFIGDDYSINEDYGGADHVIDCLAMIPAAGSVALAAINTVKSSPAALRATHQYLSAMSLGPRSWTDLNQIVRNAGGNIWTAGGAKAIMDMLIVSDNVADAFDGFVTLLDEQ